MSFRSRSQTRPVVPPRRSSSATRAPSTSYTSPYGGRSDSNYANGYNMEASRYDSQPLYQHDYNRRRQSLGSSSNLDKFATMGGSSSSHPSSAYTYRSPYKQRNRYQNDTNSYSSAYSNRYVSPYYSCDNGVTTAGLSIGQVDNSQMAKMANPYSASNLMLSRRLSSSNSSLNQGHYYPKGGSEVKRSLSLRNQIRASEERSLRSKGTSTSARSSDNKVDMRPSRSTTSLQSEGYESDTENLVDSSASNNGDNIDYKALYEEMKALNDQLKLELRGKDEELASLKTMLERYNNTEPKKALSEVEKRERRALERKISELEEELKQMHKFKNENERLRAENRALTRVVSKLTASAHNQPHFKRNDHV